MTQVARLFPHLPETVPPPGGGPAPAPIGNRLAPPGGPRKAYVPSNPGLAPANPPKTAPSGAGRKSLQQLARVITAIESNPAIDERIRTMPGMSVLRQHFEMKCVIEGLLCGLIKE